MDLSFEDIYLLPNQYIKDLLNINDIDYDNEKNEKNYYEIMKIIYIIGDLNENDSGIFKHKLFKRYFLMNNVKLREKYFDKILENAGNLNRLEIVRKLIQDQISIEKEKVKIQEIREKREKENVDEEVKLLPSQEEHFEKLVQIVNKRWPVYVDTTPMGGGKTFVTNEIGRTLAKANNKIQLIIVAPKAVHMKWERVSKKFRNNVLDILNYERLTGKKNKELKNRFLERDGNNYTVTTFFEKVVREGVFLIFDESQNNKNRKSLRSIASLTLINYITEEALKGGRSRVALLSASPGNKKEHTFNILRMVGIIKTYNKYQDAFNQTYDFSLKVNKILTTQICRRYTGLQKEEVYNYCHVLYKNVIKDFLSSSGPSPELPENADFKNGYYNITKEEDKDKIREGISLLQNIKKIDDDVEKYLGLEMTREIKEKIRKLKEKRQQNLAKVSISMTLIENGKIYDIHRIAKKTLLTKKSSKVIIGVNRRESIMRLKQYLRAFKPLILHGDVKQKDRDDIVDIFNDDSLDRRLLIMITTVGSVGLDLDDKFGQFPRYMYIVPDFKFLDQYQVTGRIARVDTKSAPTLRFFYAKAQSKNMEESNLINSIARNTDDAKDLLESDKSLKFPGDYEKEIEP